MISFKNGASTTRFTLSTIVGFSLKHGMTTETRSSLFA